jgi:hypothetical protein
VDFEILECSSMELGVVIEESDNAKAAITAKGIQ